MYWFGVVGGAVPRHPETEANRRPNERLIKARGRLRSPRHPGQRMSRAEMADGVNAALGELFSDRENIACHYVTGRWIGNLERGDHHWPSSERRAALRKVAGVVTDDELGLYPPRHTERGVSAEIIADADEIDPEPAGRGSAVAGPTHVGLLGGRRVDPSTSVGGGLVEAVRTISSLALTLDDLDRFEAVVRDARRYTDARLPAFLAACLERCAADDGLRGPRYALPDALGILTVMQHTARTAKSTFRRPLLRVGARAAEFTGWLYRDSGQSAAAEYWRDRASEWAMMVADFAMPGYVLIKKSQSAWDERDAGRMLGLAEAVQEGPWRLPARVMAEAVQQQARGMAMLNTGRRQVDDVLRKAEELLVTDGSDGTNLAAHYDSALFKVQKAICYGESGRPEEAAAIYESTLKPAVFSTRDLAYFSTLKAQTLVAAHRPDEAASTGTVALNGALAAGSARTVRELSRLRNRLEPWRERPAVRSFIRLMEAV